VFVVHLTYQVLISVSGTSRCVGNTRRCVSLHKRVPSFELVNYLDINIMSLEPTLK
jgi:hypothetical protein